MWVSLVNSLFNFLYKNVVLGRKPDLEVIHPITKEVYLHRWWIIPRNRFFNIYLHFFDEGDVPIFHDHPWHSLGMMLYGSYQEITPKHQPGSDRYIQNVKIQTSKIVRQGDIKFRTHKFCHYLLKINTKPTWTLFMTGPVLHNWGFYDKNGIWHPHTHEGRDISYD